jgi:hypothetical protein
MPIDNPMGTRDPIDILYSYKAKPHYLFLSICKLSN